MLSKIISNDIIIIIIFMMTMDSVEQLPCFRSGPGSDPLLLLLLFYIASQLLVSFFGSISKGYCRGVLRV